MDGDSAWFTPPSHLWDIGFKASSARWEGEAAAMRPVATLGPKEQYELHYLACMNVSL